MPRILGADIPGNRKLPYGLRYIFGIGPTRARMIIDASGLDPNRRSHTLTEEEVNKLGALVSEMKLIVEGDLRREVAANLKRLQTINCYRGLRHRRGLPVRGQRTQSNARTRKGKRKTMGIQKKAT